MPKLHVCLVGAALAVAVWTSPARGREAPSIVRDPRTFRGVARPSPAPSLLSTYIALVGAHVPGESDEACLTFKNWTDLDVRRASSSFLSLLNAASATSTSDGRVATGLIAAQFGLETREVERLHPAADARRAVLIHSDIAVGFCGPYYTVEHSTFHMETAQPFLQWIGQAEPTSSFPLTWYLAVGGFLTESALWNAGYILKLGVAAFPDSAQLHLAAGAVDEALTSLDVQREVDDRRLRNDARAMSRFEVKGRGAHLDRAAAHFRRALVIDPGVGEARVRLGHVLLEQGRVEEALKELEQARAGAGDQFVTYHALLFLGRLHEDAGRTARARELYEAAVALFPEAATPRIALSHLLVELGDRERALASLGPAMPAAGGNSSTRRDFWWDYANGARRQAGERFESLWQDVAGGDGRRP